MLEEFGNVIARGGAGIVIASQSGHRLPPLTVEQNKALATTPVEELLSLPFLQLDKVTDSLHAYQISKRGNSLRVMAEAVRWGKRGARLSQQGEAGPHGCFSLWSKKQVARRTAGHHHGLTAAAGRKGGVLEPPRHGATFFVAGSFGSAGAKANAPSGADCLNEPDGWRRSTTAIIERDEQQHGGCYSSLDRLVLV